MALAYLLLVLMIFLWSFSFIVVDIAVEYISPLSIALYRFMVASISFLVIDLVKAVRKTDRDHPKKEQASRHFSKREWGYIFLASLFGVSMFFFAQYTAIQLIGPSLPALFVCLLSPVIIALLALIFFEEKLNTLKASGFAIATIGGFFLVTGGNLETLTPAFANFVGYLFALTTAVLWALYSTVTKNIGTEKTNLKMLKYIGYFGTIELFILVSWRGDLLTFLEHVFTPILLLSALYLGVGCYVIGYFIWQKSQKEMKSSKVASFLYVEPFITLLFSIYFGREETIALWNILGGLIVLVAVLMINYD